MQWLSKLSVAKPDADMPALSCPQQTSHPVTCGGVLYSYTMIILSQNGAGSTAHWQVGRQLSILLPEAVSLVVE